MIGTAAILLTVALSGATTPGGTSAELGFDTPDLASLQQRPAAIQYEDTGSWVATLNDELAAAGFHADTGATFGYRTRHAVYAFQKHHGLETTGVFTTAMWDLLDTTPELTWRREADRVEVDLAKQVLYLVEDQEVALVIPISSGNGETFQNSSGRQIAARTPEGKYSFQRSIDGVRVSYLGELYNPFYFSGGYAIHGSPSVPNEPASHGCVRITNWDMDLLKNHFEIGQTLYIYGQNTPEPPRETVANPAQSAV